MQRCTCLLTLLRQGSLFIPAEPAVLKKAPMSTEALLAKFVSHWCSSWLYWLALRLVSSVTGRG